MMNEVTIDKNRLIEQLEVNREKHINTFSEVLEAYRNKAVELLEEHIERIRDGSVEKVHVSLPVPQNYEEEYTRTIEMLKWSEDEQVKLSEHEFDQYVRDNWKWKGEFIAASSAYTNS